MGVFTAAARNLFLSFFALLISAMSLSCPALAEGQKRVAAQTQTSATSSYEEKKRQANDIAVSVVVTGLSCTCARFTEDMRNVVNDLSPDGIRILPVLGVGCLLKISELIFVKNIGMDVVPDDHVRQLR
jgi:hypothetical protein